MPREAKTNIETKIRATMKYPKRPFLIFLTLSLIVGTLGLYSPKESKAQEPVKTLRPVQPPYPSFHDDLKTKSLILAIRRNLSVLSRLPPARVFDYGPHKFTCRQVIESQKAFLDILREKPEVWQLQQEIQNRFNIYHATDRHGKTRVLFTAYFKPIYEASLTPDQTFRYPIYREPHDLVRIRRSCPEHGSKSKYLVGRIENNKFVSYYSRYEIDSKKVLKGRNLEIAWLKNPVDVAFLHIQGSGKLNLTNGKAISVTYKAANGRPYRSIGQYMIEKGIISPEEISMHTIRTYLSNHPEMAENILNKNPSYVFFQVTKKGPLGNMGTPLTPGRSIALDNRIFPTGALAFIKCCKPNMNNSGQIDGWTPFSRFVLNQDTGSAINGPRRTDLFMGDGPYAELVAGHLKHYGELYILIKKPRSRLSSAAKRNTMD